MKKNSILLLAMTLIIAFCFTPSVMAKKITYLGYQYNGKINKENIPEGKGTIMMSVPDLINSGNMSEFAIRGIFNGPIITDAYFSTTWLSYKGEVEIKEGNSFVLKKGGVITTNAYFFTGMNIRPELIQHYDIEVSEDTPANYLGLTNIPITTTIPFSLKRLYSDKIKQLNPPANISCTIYPSKCKTKKQNNGTWSDFYIIYYDLNNVSTPSTFTDAEGRVWKEISSPSMMRDYVVTYPDGSFCSYETGYERVERVSSDKSTFINRGLYKLILPTGVIIYEQSYIQKEKEESLKLGNTAPYRLKVVNMSDNGIRDNAKSYVSGENKKIMVNENTVLEIYKGDGSTFNDYGRIKQIFNDSILPYLTIKEGYSVKIYRKEPDNTVYTALEYKDGVIKTEAQLKEEEDRAEADYEKSIASFKKKYGFDPSVDSGSYVVKVGRNLIGVLDDRNEWITKYHKKLNRIGNTGIITVSLRNDQGSRKCYNFYYDGYYQGYIWVKNNIITSVSWK